VTEADDTDRLVSTVNIEQNYSAIKKKKKD